MKFTITVKDTRNHEWTEDYDKPEVHGLQGAQNWAKRTIENFNATLRPHETKRTLVDVQLSEEQKPSKDVPSEHVWNKTNLTTLLVRGRMYDALRCAICGITAKRFGMDRIVRDNPYKSVGYASCSRSIELQKKRDARKR